MQNHLRSRVVMLGLQYRTTCGIGAPARLHLARGVMVADGDFGFALVFGPGPNRNGKSNITTRYRRWFCVGDGDTRVAPLHARKMAALMQTVATPDRPVLIRYELVAGHAGGRSVTQTIGDDVDEFSFLFWQLGIEP